MGFYGNITNTSNTTFSFDRIYPNRLAMDANVNNDGIFIGRYVLVEYEQSAAYPNIYINNGKYYSSPNFEEVTRIKYKSGGRPASDTSNDAFYLGEFGQKQESEKIYFYMCDGYETVEENLYATFKQVTVVNKDDATPYLINHNIDYEEYKNAKGYDSSVWTKVNEEKNGKLVTRYRNIADLNSVVPTFDLETDAPTMTPITPHFDADSTNVYYKLHTQPQWGLRVAAQEDENSDSTTTWQFTTYNPTTDETITREEKNKAAAINFNGPAFDAQVGKASILKHDSGENYITILPTGESGKKYYTHTNKNGEKVYEQAPDIQEMRINLPAIGNMMSDAWDIIHGKLRNDYQGDGENASLQGRLDSINALADDTIPVKRDQDGKIIGSKLNGGKTTNTDYTGKNDDEWIETLVNGNEEKITIHHTYDLEDKNKYKDIGHLEESLNIDNDTSNKIDLNNGINTLDINTPIVDSMGHVVGRNTETITLPYGYKTIKVTNTNDDAILNAAQIINPNGQIADNTQDELTLSASNRWIKLDNNSEDTIQFGHQVNPIEEKDKDLTDLNDGTDTITIQDTIYDEAGHVTANQKHTYTLPYGYKFIKVANDGDTTIAAPVSATGTQTADSTQDTLKLTTSNKWVLLDSGTEDTVKFGHLLSPLPKGEHASTDTTLGGFGESFNILKYETDEAGHIVASGEDTITLPIGSYEPANSATTHTDIITSIGFTPLSGAITSTKATTDTLTLSNYSANNGNLSILYTDTINKGFEKVQNHINSLEMSSISTTEFITEITQIDGQVAVKRAAAGTLQLGTASTDDTIPATSSLNNAFNITNARIKKEEDALAKEIQDRKDAIDALTGTKDYSEHFDTMKEIADWLDVNKDGVVDITLNVSANATAIGNEKTRAEGIEAGLQEQINALGTASTKNIEDFATSTQGTTAETTAATVATYGDIVTYNAEDFVLKSEYNALLSDFNELKTLVEQLNNQINPPQ